MSLRLLKTPMADGYCCACTDFVVAEAGIAIAVELTVVKKSRRRMNWDERSIATPHEYSTGIA